MGYCKIKYTLCTAQHVWQGLHWVIGRAGQVVCGGCGFAEEYWSFPIVEALLGNHSTQSSASV